MNAIEKMQKEGTLEDFVADALHYKAKCPGYYGLENECDTLHDACWLSALTKDYDEEHEPTREECEEYLNETSKVTAQVRGE